MPVSSSAETLRPARRIQRASRKRECRSKRESLLSRLRRANVEEQRDVIAKFSEGFGIQRACGLRCARLANFLKPQAGRDHRVDIVGQCAIEARHGELLDLRGIWGVAELPAIDPCFVVEI